MLAEEDAAALEEQRLFAQKSAKEMQDYLQVAYGCACIDIYVYINVCVCVCMYVCMYVCTGVLAEEDAAAQEEQRLFAQKSAKEVQDYLQVAYGCACV